MVDLTSLFQDQGYGRFAFADYFWSIRRSVARMEWHSRYVLALRLSNTLEAVFCAEALEAQRGLEDYFQFYNGFRHHQALGYRTPAEVFHGEQEAVAEESHRRRCSPERGPNHWQESRDSHLTRP